MIWILHYETDNVLRWPRPPSTVKAASAPRTSPTRTWSAPRSTSSPRERRPSVETVRERLGRGSASTIATCLKRFWRDLGIRAQGDSAALTRLPSEIAEAVEAIWQRALALAAQSAKSEDNAARERLEQLRIENEVRAQSFEMRERAYESAARERERALADSRDHLLVHLADAGDGPGHAQSAGDPDCRAGRPG